MNHKVIHIISLATRARLVKRIIGITLTIFILNACTIESRIAKEYLLRNDSVAIMFFRPSYLYLTSLKEYEIENKDELDEYELDSTLYANSLFLQHIDEQEFLDKYCNSLLDELRKLDFKVFTGDQLDTFLTLESKEKYMISIAQLELEEYVLPFKDEEIIEGSLYYKNVDLNAVNVNTWFELTKMNDDFEEQQILFASHYILDDYESNFRYYPYTGDVSHTFNIDSIVMQDIYYLGTFLGNKYAGYIHDYLMNMYIINNLPENIKPGVYYHYDRRYNRFYPAYDDRLIPMED